MKKTILTGILYGVVFGFAPAIVWQSGIPFICVGSRNSSVIIYDRDLTLVDSVSLPGPVTQKIAWEPESSDVMIVVATANGWLSILNWDGEHLEILEQIRLSEENPYSSPVFADIDGDGVVEIITVQDTALFCVSISGDIIWHTPIESAYPPVATPSVGDIDGDFLPEIVIETYEALWVFESDGSVMPNFPVYLSGYDPYARFSYSSPILWDSDNDGKCEIYAGLHQVGGTYSLGLFGGWDETGARITEGFYGTSGYGGWIYSPISICDPDGDGLPDMIFADIRGNLYGVNSSMDIRSFGNSIFNSGAGRVYGGVICADVNSQAGAEYIFIAFEDDTLMKICVADNSKQWLSGFPERVIVDDDAIVSPAVFYLNDTVFIAFAYVDGRVWVRKIEGEPFVGQSPWCELFGDRRNTGCFSPLPPRSIAAERSGDSIVIQWSACFGAEFYSLFRSSDSSGASAETVLTTTDTFAVLPLDTSWFFVISRGELRSSFRSVAVRIADPAGVSESFGNCSSSLLVFPNPVNCVTQVNSGCGAVRIELTDISGKTIMQMYTNGPKVNLDFSGIPSGVYVIVSFDDFGRLVGQARITVIR